MFGVTTIRGTVLKCPGIRKVENAVLEDSNLMEVLPMLFNLLIHSLLHGGEFIFCLTLLFFLLCSLFFSSNPNPHKEYTYCGNDFLNHKGDVTQCLFFPSLTHRILAECDFKILLCKCDEKCVLFTRTKTVPSVEAPSWCASLPKMRKSVQWAITTQQVGDKRELWIRKAFLSCTHRVE